MRFLSLEISNYLSFQAKQTINLANRGLLGVVGYNKDAKQADSNGAGKSTILEAIIWCLYGTTIRKVKADEVVNREVGKDCIVSLLMEDEQETYRVTRTYKDSNTKKANDLILEINGVTATAGTNSDTQDLINVIMGMNVDTFMQSVMLHWGKSFCSMTDADQKAILEDILQISHISEARELVKGRLGTAQTELAIIQNKISNLKGKQQELDLRFTHLTKLFTEYEGIKANKVSELNNKKKSIETEMVALNSMVSSEELGKRIKGLEKEITAIRKEEAALSLKASDMLQTIMTERSFKEKQLAIMEHQIRTDAGNAIKLGELVNTACPTCTQSVTPDYVDQMLTLYDVSSKKLRLNIEDINASLFNLKDKEAGFINIINELKSKLEEKKTNLAKKQQSLHEDKAKYDYNQKLIQKLVLQANEVMVQIDRLTNEENPYKVLLEGNKQEADQTIEELASLVKAQAILDTQVKHLLFWDHGFSNKGLKSFVIENVIPFMNERAQYYLDILSDGDIKIEFSTHKTLKSGAEKEQFEVKVVNRQGADVYRGNSDGEKRRTDIAVGWALGDLAATRSKKALKFKCIDEMFDSLDESGQDAVIKLLYNVTPQYETVMVISHDTNLGSQFPKEIQVIKEHGASRIVET